VKIVDTIRARLARWLTRGAGADAFLHALTTPYQHGHAAAWADDPQEQVKHFKHWVFACVKAISNRVAASPLRLYTRLPGGQAKELFDHPLLELFNYVNPFHTRFWLWSETMTFLELTGNCYWYVPANGLRAPAEIWIVHSQHMKVIPDKDKFIRGYEYRNGANEITFSPDEIVHLKYPNPTDPYYGRATLQAAAESVDAHEARSTAHFNMMRRGVFPGIGLATEQELSEDVIKRLAAQIELKHSTPEKAGRPIVLEKGLKAERLDLAPNEMALLESSKITRDEILAIFTTPAAVLGISEDVARAAADAMDVMFARYCIAPRLQMLEDQLNQDLLPRYDKKLFCKFDVIMPEDKTARTTELRKDFKAGIITLNEARAESGRKQREGGNVRYMPNNIMPITEGSARVSPKARHQREPSAAGTRALPAPPAPAAGSKQHHVKPQRTAGASDK